MPSPFRVLVAAWLAVAAAACASRPPQTAVGGSPATVSIQLLAFNDFHGNLEPPNGANGRLGDLTVGGVEYLAAHVARLEATNPNTIVVSAGDNIGGSPLVSSLFHDEPTIRALDALGLDFSTVGNHEFDEGWRELVRMQRGGCHPTDGCRGADGFDGATFRYLAANVRHDDTGETLFPATALRTFAGVTIGFVGLVLRDTVFLVQPTGIEGLTFLPEADVANAAAAALRREGADVVVVLIHEGAIPGPDSSCGTLAGRIVDVVGAMSSAIDVVVTGHTNHSFVCRLGSHLVTGTASYGREVTDIDIVVNRQSGRVVSSEAVNIPITRDIAPVRTMTELIDEYRTLAAEVGARRVGAIAASLTRVQNRAGETTAGSAIADGMLAVASASTRGGAQLALMNRGGVRAELTHRAALGTETPMTYADAFAMLPFANFVVVQTLTGAQLADILEQQFETPGPLLLRVLQVSHNVQYRWSAARPVGSRVDRASIRINGRPIDPAASYRVAMPDFIWNGGDGFTAAAAGTDPVVTGQDIDVFIEYLGTQTPLSPPALGRIVRED